MCPLEVSENSLIHRSKLHLEKVQKYWRVSFNRNICMVTFYRIFCLKLIPIHPPKHYALLLSNKKFLLQPKWSILCPQHVSHAFAHTVSPYFTRNVLSFSSLPTSVLQFFKAQVGSSLWSSIISPSSEILMSSSAHCLACFHDAVLWQYLESSWWTYECPSWDAGNLANLL